MAYLKRGATQAWRLEEHLQSQAIPITGDMNDVTGWAADFAAFKPDTIIHLAWQGITAADRNTPNQLQNTAQTLELLKLAITHGVQHFIGLGSQAEYGPCDNIVTEQQPTWPNTYYGLAKLSACMIARDICAENGVRFAWLRLFSAYGPKDGPDWLIPYVTLSLLKGQLPSLSPCEHFWDYIHVADAARGILAVAESETAEGIFNLGSGTAPRLADMITIVRDSIAPTLPLGFGEIPYKEGQVMNLQADVGRLQSETGWQCRISLKEGLESTAQWYKENISRFQER